MSQGIEWVWIKLKAEVAQREGLEKPQQEGLNSRGWDEAEVDCELCEDKAKTTRKNVRDLNKHVYKTHGVRMKKMNEAGTNYYTLVDIKRKIEIGQQKQQKKDLVFQPEERTLCLTIGSLYRLSLENPYNVPTAFAMLKNQNFQFQPVQAILQPYEKMDILVRKISNTDKVEERIILRCTNVHVTEKID